MTYTGIDGCKAGWLAWVVTENTRPKMVIGESLDALAAQIGETGVWLVDMPIGFSTPEQPDRLCDKAARALLKGRRASVFSVPCREAVYSESYERACEQNVARLGKKFSKQTWGIVPKMRELDAFVRSRRSASLSVREAHPELAFAGLSGQPMAWNKKCIEGHQERLALLNHIAPDWMAVLNSALASVPRKVAEKDDILDAFVLMCIAMRPEEWVSVPNPASDLESGLPREIVYLPSADVS